MGIGSIKSLGKTEHRRWRWTFEGKDKDGNVSFPMNTVRVNVRPKLDANKLSITVFDYQNWKSIPEIQTFLSDVFQTRKTASTTTSGILKLYDGVGIIIEEWEIYGITMEQTGHEVMENVVTFDWEICYESIKYNNRVPAWGVHGCTEVV